MKTAYGEVSQFPHIGCGANYLPWKRGPSMVCEIQMRAGSGDWEAFLADHTPPALDDMLKKLNFDALSKAFSELSPETIYTAIPMTMPMTHLATAGGRTMAGVARYPVDAWIAADAPTFTNERWAMICLLIAERARQPSLAHSFSLQDMEVFDRMFDTASMMQTTRSYGVPQ